MATDYGYEKFSGALNYAIGSTDSVQERLANVASEVCHLERDSFPNDELWQQFEVLMNATSGRAAKRDEGTIAATTCQMSNAEAAKWLRRALSIFSDLAEAFGHGER
jgi:hypothetical protein